MVSTNSLIEFLSENLLISANQKLADEEEEQRKAEISTPGTSNDFISANELPQRLCTYEVWSDITVHVSSISPVIILSLHPIEHISRQFSKFTTFCPIFQLSQSRASLCTRPNLSFQEVPVTSYHRSWILVVSKLCLFVEIVFVSPPSFIYTRLIGHAFSMLLLLHGHASPASFIYTRLIGRAFSMSLLLHGHASPASFIYTRLIGRAFSMSLLLHGHTSPASFIYTRLIGRAFSMYYYSMAMHLLLHLFILV